MMILTTKLFLIQFFLIGIIEKTVSVNKMEYTDSLHNKKKKNGFGKDCLSKYIANINYDKQNKSEFQHEAELKHNWASKMIISSEIMSRMIMKPMFISGMLISSA